MADPADRADRADPAGAAGAADGTAAWRVTVDRSACLGSGICAALAPELFALDGERSRAVRERTEPGETVLDAADSCPAAAITVSEGKEIVGPRP
ncbi:ferredoxin [Streptomyces sp. URMC 124]|uniref:ferredoxin n=1 Tax=Streptomyces sp. URMC 124 TaxID=3423405 RepID=UPI003F1C1B23